MRFKSLAPCIQVELKHVGQSVNGLADILAKPGVDRPPSYFSLIGISFIAQSFDWHLLCIAFPH